MVLRLAVLVIALSLSSAAHAAEAPVSPEAKRHVDAGVEHYNAGRFAEAAKEFELAYRLSSRPALLFNIARAEAKLGHDETAIAFLRRYLEERPDAPDAPAVLAEIEAHQNALAAAQARQQAEKETASAQKEAARAASEAAAARRANEEMTTAAAAREREAARAQAEVAERAQSQRRGRSTVLRRAGIALVVIGPVLAITGIALGAVASQASDDVMKSKGDFTTCCADAQSRGQISSGLGIGFDVIGGVATLAGAALIGVSFK